MRLMYLTPMSTRSSTDISETIERCRPADVTPVRLEANTLDSTTPDYLRDLARELSSEGLTPVTLSVSACFDEDCSLSVQSEVDRVRGFVRAGSFLGVSRMIVSCDTIANPATVRPALAACAERADREGITLDVEAPLSLEDGPREEFEGERQQSQTPELEH